jgi:hypothetical protein
MSVKKLILELLHNEVLQLRADLVALAFLTSLIGGAYG